MVEKDHWEAKHSEMPLWAWAQSMYACDVGKALEHIINLLLLL